MKYLLLLIIGSSLLLSCRFMGGKRVRGNGNMTTEERSVSSFDEVESYGSFDVEISAGPQNSVKVEAEENLQHYIETISNGNKLEIRTRHGYNLRPRDFIKIHIVTPTISSVTSNGSGNIIGQNLITSDRDVELGLYGSGNIEMDLQAPSVSTVINGSGNISVKGTSKQFSGAIHGSGNIRAADLKAEESKVEIAGSGSVDVFAINSLDVNIMGSGGVTYRGDAKISSHIAGSGSVNKVD